MYETGKRHRYMWQRKGRERAIKESMEDLRMRLEVEREAEKRRCVHEEGKQQNRQRGQRQHRKVDRVTETEAIPYIFYLFRSSKALSIFKLH